MGCSGSHITASKTSSNSLASTKIECTSGKNSRQHLQPDRDLFKKAIESTELKATPVSLVKSINSRVGKSEDQKKSIVQESGREREEDEEEKILKFLKQCINQRKKLIQILQNSKKMRKVEFNQEGVSGPLSISMNKVHCQIEEQEERQSDNQITPVIQRKERIDTIISSDMVKKSMDDYSSSRGNLDPRKEHSGSSGGFRLSKVVINREKESESNNRTKIIIRKKIERPLTSLGTLKTKNIGAVGTRLPQNRSYSIRDVFCGPRSAPKIKKPVISSPHYNSINSKSKFFSKGTQHFDRSSQKNQKTMNNTKRNLGQFIYPNNDPKKKNSNTSINLLSNLNNISQVIQRKVR